MSIKVSTDHVGVIDVFTWFASKGLRGCGRHYEGIPLIIKIILDAFWILSFIARVLRLLGFHGEEI